MLAQGPDRYVTGIEAIHLSVCGLDNTSRCSSGVEVCGSDKGTEGEGDSGEEAKDALEAGKRVMHGGQSWRWHSASLSWDLCVSLLFYRGIGDRAPCMCRLGGGLTMGDGVLSSVANLDTVAGMVWSRLQCGRITLH